MRAARFAAVVLSILGASVAYADKYDDTIALFKNSGASDGYFSRCYGYAVFPTIAEGGFILGGAGGKGRVYVNGALVGDSTMSQISAGFLAGGKAYSQIIFFEDKRAVDEFESGTFEFGAGASAVAVTAGANAGVGTTGAESGASGGEKDATTNSAGYNRGMLVFTIAKGGLMFSVQIAGQRFTYTARGAR